MKHYFWPFFDVRRDELPQLIPLFLNYLLLILTYGCQIAVTGLPSRFKASGHGRGR